MSSCLLDKMRFITLFPQVGHAGLIRPLVSPVNQVHCRSIVNYLHEYSHLRLRRLRLAELPKQSFLILPVGYDINSFVIVTNGVKSNKTFFLECFQVEVKNLQSLCKRKDAGDKEIQACAANGGGTSGLSSKL